MPREYFEHERRCQPRKMKQVYQSLRRVWRQAQCLLLPPSCIACGAGGPGLRRDLCSGCANELPLNRIACSYCALPLSAAATRLICGACIKSPPAYDSSICAFRYAYPIDHFVRALKYGQRLAHARVLGELLAEQLEAQLSLRPQCLVPVPLSTKRFRERGYNQVIELGRVLEHWLDIEMRPDLATRVRHTAEQAGLSRRERRKNLRHAFAVHSPIPKHIAILDDVITTGSTVNELARMCSQAGAERIDVWAVARAS